MGFMMAFSEDRLERMEEKLDKLQEAVVALARMEERMVTLFNRMDKYDDEQKNNRQRIEVLEKRTGLNGQTLRFAERVFWIVAASSVAFWFSHQ